MRYLITLDHGAGLESSAVAEDEDHLSRVIERFGKAVVAVSPHDPGEALPTRGRGRPAGAWSANIERDAEILRLYEEENASSPQLERMFGISRERVCQILRKTNTIETRLERRRIAQAALKQERTRIKRAAVKDRRDRMSAAVELVRAGESMRQASVQAGLSPSMTNQLGAECRAAGVPVRHGRHGRDWSERRRRVKELYDKDMPRSQIVRALREEDPTIHDAWISQRMPELKFRRRASPKVADTSLVDAVNAYMLQHAGRHVKAPAVGKHLRSMGFRVSGYTAVGRALAHSRGAVRRVGRGVYTYDES